MPLNLAPNFTAAGPRAGRAGGDYAAADDFYETLIAAHQDLSEAQSARLNARLILLLANQVGDVAVLREAIALARRGVAAAQDAPAGGGA